MHQAQRQKWKDRKRGRARHLRGMTGEENFLEAWRNEQHYPPWLRNVRRATRREDKFQKTDAVMQTTIGDFRIQIKSSLIRVSKIHGLINQGILVVYVDILDTPDEIRQKTLESIEYFRTKKGLREFTVPQENQDHLAPN